MRPHQVGQVKRHVLALARDRGSMQAIAPVIVALEASGTVEVNTYVTNESLPVAAESGVHSRLLDDTSFATDPRRA